MHACISVYVWIACMYACLPVCMDLCAYVCMHVCMYVCMCVCGYVRLSVCGTEGCAKSHKVHVSHINPPQTQPLDLSHPRRLKSPKPPSVYILCTQDMCVSYYWRHNRGMYGVPGHSSIPFMHTNKHTGRGMPPVRIPRTYPALTATCQSRGGQQPAAHGGRGP